MKIKYGWFNWKAVSPSYFTISEYCHLTTNHKVTTIQQVRYFFWIKMTSSVWNFILKSCKRCTHVGISTFFAFRSMSRNRPNSMASSDLNMTMEAPAAIMNCLYLAEIHPSKARSTVRTNKAVVLKRQRTPLKLCWHLHEKLQDTIHSRMYYKDWNMSWNL